MEVGVSQSELVWRGSSKYGWGRGQPRAKLWSSGTFHADPTGEARKLHVYKLARDFTCSCSTCSVGCHSCHDTK